MPGDLSELLGAQRLEDLRPAQCTNVIQPVPAHDFANEPRAIAFDYLCILHVLGHLIST
jgi:hypothetical protein